MGQVGVGIGAPGGVVIGEGWRGRWARWGPWSRWGPYRQEEKLSLREPKNKYYIYEK